MFDKEGKTRNPNYSGRLFILYNCGTGNTSCAEEEVTKMNKVDTKLNFEDGKTLL